MSKLALFSGPPTRSVMLNYGKQTIDEDDVNSIVDILRKNTYLTTGPYVKKFEDDVKKYVGAKYAVAVSNGTAALHCAMFAAGVHDGDEVIVPAISFIATSNCVLYLGAKPIFCDVKNTMNIDPDKIEHLITPKTKALIVTDMCGQTCEYDKIIPICKKHNITLISDSAHSFGSSFHEYGKTGNIADMTTFSFHPVKHITTGEGGMIVTNNKEYYDLLKTFRSHGISTDYSDRGKHTHCYHMMHLGMNYRITDIQCALGITQLKKLDYFIDARKKIAKTYDDKFGEFSELFKPVTQIHDNVYHIYVIRLNLDNLKTDRDTIFAAFREEGIGVNVHYMPIYLHPYYIKNVGTYEGMCPTSEKIYNEIITLPIYPTMTDEDVIDVINATIKIMKYFKK
jgi:perosamine synthetase